MKKKILFLIHTLGVGGAEKVLVNLVNNMDKTKYDITVMTIINTGAFIEELCDDVKYKYMFNIPFSKKTKDKSNSKKESGSLLNKTSKIKEILKKIYQFIWRHMPCKIIYRFFIKEKYDYEIAFLEGITAKVISASTNENAKKIAWIHVDLINEKKSEKVFKNIKNEKETYNKFNTIVAVSEVVKKQFIQKFEFDDKKVLVKYNPIDNKEIIEKSKEKIDINTSKDIPILCTVGRLSMQKGYDRLVKVMNKLKDDGFKFVLWIIGVGPEEKKLQEYIQEKKLEKNVILLGYQKNPYKFIKKSDIFVCSSRAEGYSTVVTEAVVLNKPIVTTNCSGMEEILGKDSKYGLITKNTEEDLYEGIKKMLKEREVIEKYKRNVIERSKQFELKKFITEIEKIFI